MLLTLQVSFNMFPRESYDAPSDAHSVAREQPLFHEVIDHPRRYPEVLGNFFHGEESGGHRSEEKAHPGPARNHGSGVVWRQG